MGTKRSHGEAVWEAGRELDTLSQKWEVPAESYGEALPQKQV